MRKFITILTFVFLSILSFGQTDREMALFNEVNNFRSNPKSYIPLVEDYIKLQGMCIDMVKDGSMVIKSGNGKMDKDNNMYEVKSLNGLNRIKAEIKAANELLSILDTLVLDTIIFSSEMYKISKIHNIHLDSVKKIGHFGTNGTSPHDRFKDTGYTIGENLSTLGNIGDTMTFKSTILTMLVDAGISNRGHRLMLIKPNYTHGSVGISSYEKTSSGFTYDNEYCIVNLGYKKEGY